MMHVVRGCLGLSLALVASTTFVFFESKVLELAVPIKAMWKLVVYSLNSLSIQMSTYRKSLIFPTVISHIVLIIILYSPHN